MAKISLLDDHLISQIAAGEVVERPASVVKELIENAVDAGASSVRIELEGGGKRSIRVIDDGHGMGEEDAALAFGRHATSKIRSFEDLQKVETLGFRGEALSSIGAVARVEMITGDGDGAHRVHLDGGRSGPLEPAARRRGTTVEVSELFYNVPARRKFLKRTATELRRCVEVVQGYALAQQEMRFVLTHEGRRLLDAPANSLGREGLRARIGQIFGPALEERLLDVGPRELEEGGRISGFVGNRETTRGRRIFLFVNRRLIRDRALLAVFYRGVRTEWKSDQFPALFLFLEVPATLVDVNVHPQKAEVRFRDPRFVGAVSRSLSRALAEERGEEVAVGVALEEGVEVPSLSWRGLGEYSWETGARSPTSSMRKVSSHGYSDKIAEVSYHRPARPAIRLSGRSDGPGSLRLLGQYKGTLLLLEGPDGLYLIDQHVAHERILYERFRAALETQSPSSQKMLSPLLLDLSASEASVLLECRKALEACGFAITEMSGATVALTALPSMLDSSGAEKLLLDFVSRIVEAGEEAIDLPGELLSSLAAGLSCRSAVKMHHPLSPAEMEALVAELFQAEQPFACPHGRPIVLKMGDADLEKRFGRR